MRAGVTAQEVAEVMMRMEELAQEVMAAAMPEVVTMEEMVEVVMTMGEMAKVVMAEEATEVVTTAEEVEAATVEVTTATSGR